MSKQVFKVCLTNGEALVSLIPLSAVREVYRIGEETAPEHGPVFVYQKEEDARRCLDTMRPSFPAVLVKGKARGLRVPKARLDHGFFDICETKTQARKQRILDVQHRTGLFWKDGFFPRSDMHVRAVPEGTLVCEGFTPEEEIERLPAAENFKSAAQVRDEMQEEFDAEARAREERRKEKEQDEGEEGTGK